MGHMRILMELLLILLLSCISSTSFAADAPGLATELYDAYTSSAAAAASECMNYIPSSHAISSTCVTGSNEPIGTICIATCQQNYYSNGTNGNICNADGTWSNSQTCDSCTA